MIDVFAIPSWKYFWHVSQQWNTFMDGFAYDWTWTIIFVELETSDQGLLQLDLLGWLKSVQGRVWLNTYSNFDYLRHKEILTYNHWKPCYGFGVIISINMSKKIHNWCHAVISIRRAQQTHQITYNSRPITYLRHVNIYYYSYCFVPNKNDKQQQATKKKRSTDRDTIKPLCVRASALFGVNTSSRTHTHTHPACDSRTLAYCLALFSDHHHDTRRPTIPCVSRWRREMKLCMNVVTLPHIRHKHDCNV